MKNKGSCHCGNVQFEFDGDIEKGATCNCSICHKRGTVLTFVSDDKFHLISGKESLKDYQFGKKSIHHYFCSNCGVTSFSEGKSPSGQAMRAVNLRCIDGFDIKAIPLSEFDGKSL